MGEWGGGSVEPFTAYKYNISSKWLVRAMVARAWTARLKNSEKSV